MFAACGIKHRRCCLLVTWACGVGPQMLCPDSRIAHVNTTASDRVIYLTDKLLCHFRLDIGLDNWIGHIWRRNCFIVVAVKGTI